MNPRAWNVFCADEVRTFIYPTESISYAYFNGAFNEDNVAKPAEKSGVSSERLSSRERRKRNASTSNFHARTLICLELDVLKLHEIYRVVNGLQQFELAQSYISGWKSGLGGKFLLYSVVPYKIEQSYAYGRVDLTSARILANLVKFLVMSFKFRKRVFPSVLIRALALNKERKRTKWQQWEEIRRMI